MVEDGICGKYFSALLPVNPLLGANITTAVCGVPFSPEGVCFFCQKKQQCGERLFARRLREAGDTSRSPEDFVKRAIQAVIPVYTSQNFRLN